MWPAMVVDADPFADDPAGVLQRLKSMPLQALLLGCLDHVFDHSVLYGAARRDEFVSQPVATNQRREAAAGED